MNTPQPQAPPATTPDGLSDPVPNPSGYNGHDTLSQTEAAKVATWIKEELAAGKVSQAQADAMFAELNTPIEHRGPDTRSAEQMQSTNFFPPQSPKSFSFSTRSLDKNVRWTLCKSKI